MPPMRELDISIMPFFEYEYDTLSDADKQLFIRLLENDDPDLFNWLMNGKPADAAADGNLNSDTESGTWSCGNLISVSPGARRFSLLLHGVVAALVLLPWPLSYTPIWLLLLSLVVFDCVRSQRRIHARREIKLTDSRLRWQNAEWEISDAVGHNSGMLLRLRHVDTRRGQHLWLAADSMEPESGAICAGWCCKTGAGVSASGKCSAISPRICSHQLWMRSSLRSYWLVSSSARPTNSWPSAITGFGLVNS
jgi:toxin CptA